MTSFLIPRAHPVHSAPPPPSRGQPINIQITSGLRQVLFPLDTRNPLEKISAYDLGSSLIAMNNVYIYIDACYLFCFLFGRPDWIHLLVIVLWSYNIISIIRDVAGPWYHSKSVLSYDWGP